MNKSKTEKSLNTGKENKIRQNYHKKTVMRGGQRSINVVITVIKII